MADALESRAFREAGRGIVWGDENGAQVGGTYAGSVRLYALVHCGRRVDASSDPSRSGWKASRSCCAGLLIRWRERGEVEGEWQQYERE